MITSELDCKVFFNSVTVFTAADKELPSAKLYIDAFETKKNKSFIKKLNRIGPLLWSLEGHKKLSFENRFFYQLYEHADFGF